jgi:hypothetical protein
MPLQDYHMDLAMELAPGTENRNGSSYIEKPEIFKLHEAINNVFA